MNERRARIESLGDDAFRKASQAARSRAAMADEGFLGDPINAKPRDAAIYQKIKALVLQDGSLCIVRYFSVGHDNKIPKKLYCWVFYGNWARRIFIGNWEDLKRNSCLELPILTENDREYRVPNPRYCEEIWKRLIFPWVKEWRKCAFNECSNGCAIESSKGDLKTARQSIDLPGRILLIPTDELFAVPLHVAVEGVARQDGEATTSKDETKPLAMRSEVFYSASAAVYLERGIFLRKQAVGPDDDLWAHRGPSIENNGSCEANPDFLKKEVCWREDRLKVTQEDCSFADIERIGEQYQREFVVLACHGEKGLLRFLTPAGDHSADNLSYLSPLDVALRLRLDRNKLAMVNACLSGLDSNAGAEIDGFLRAFVAAGAGVLTLTLWHVKADVCKEATKHLLKAAVAAGKENNALDCVEVIKEFYNLGEFDQNEQIERCVFAMYY